MSNGFAVLPLLKQLIAVAHGGVPVSLGGGHGAIPQAAPRQHLAEVVHCLLPVQLPEGRTDQIITCPFADAVRVPVKRAEALRQGKLIDPALEVALLDQNRSVVAEGKVIHAIDLGSLVRGIQLAQCVKRLDGSRPILGCDQLLGAGKGLLGAGEIGRGRQRRCQRGGGLVAQHQDFGVFLLCAGEGRIVGDDPLETLFGDLVPAELDVDQRVLVLFAELAHDDRGLVVAANVEAG